MIDLLGFVFLCCLFMLIDDLLSLLFITWLRAYDFAWMVEFGYSFCC